MALNNNLAVVILLQSVLATSCIKDGVDGGFTGKQPQDRVGASRTTRENAGGILPVGINTNIILTVISSRANSAPSKIVKLLQSVRQAGGHSDVCLVFVPIPRGETGEGESWRLPSAALDEIVQLFNYDARGKIWFHILKFCSACQDTTVFREQHNTWAKYEGWRGAMEVLSSNRHYGKVLWMDADAYVQRNPFTIDEIGGTLADVYFSFSPYMYIDNDPHGRLMDAYNSSCCYSRLIGQQRGYINSGIVYGTWKGMMAMLHATLKHLTDDWLAPRCCLVPWRGAHMQPALACTAHSSLCTKTSGLDQIALNYVAHFGMVHARIKPYAFPFVVPICSISRFAAPRDAIGRVLVDVGGPPCHVVHMYNRYMVRGGAYGALVGLHSVIDSKYAYVPKEDRLLFPGNGTHRYGTLTWVVERLCNRQPTPQWSCQQGDLKQKCEFNHDASWECTISPDMAEQLDSAMHELH